MVGRLARPRRVFPGDCAAAGPSMALQVAASAGPPYAGPPLPLDEEERVNALRTLQIKEGQADPVLDSLCNLVCSLLKVRMAGAAAPPVQTPCPPVLGLVHSYILSCLLRRTLVCQRVCLESEVA